jgi:hypothetical protein
LVSCAHDILPYPRIPAPGDECNILLSPVRLQVAAPGGWIDNNYQFNLERTEGHEEEIS